MCVVRDTHRAPREQSLSTFGACSDRGSWCASRRRSSWGLKTSNKFTDPKSNEGRPHFGRTRPDKARIWIGDAGRPEEADPGRGNNQRLPTMLPESCPLAIRTRDLRSCPNVPQRSAQEVPKVGRRWTNVVNLGPPLANLCRTSTKFGWYWSMLARFGAILATTSPHLADTDQSWVEVGHNFGRAVPPARLDASSRVWGVPSCSGLKPAEDLVTRGPPRQVLPRMRRRSSESQRQQLRRPPASTIAPPPISPP